MVQGNIENIGDPVDRLRRVLRGESPPEGDWLQDKIKDIKNHAKVGDMYVTKIPFKSRRTGGENINLQIFIKIIGRINLTSGDVGLFYSTYYPLGTAEIMNRKAGWDVEVEETQVPAELLSFIERYPSKSIATNTTKRDELYFLYNLELLDKGYTLGKCWDIWKQANDIIEEQEEDIGSDMRNGELYLKNVTELLTYYDMTAGDFQSVMDDESGLPARGSEQGKNIANRFYEFIQAGMYSPRMVGPEYTSFYERMLESQSIYIESQTWMEPETIRNGWHPIIKPIPNKPIYIICYFHPQTNRTIYRLPDNTRTVSRQRASRGSPDYGTMVAE